MPDQLELGPLRFEQAASEITVAFVDPDAPALDIPGDYEQTLRDHLGPFLAAQQPFILDLGELPAVSSRQLGLMLTLHKVIQPQYHRLQLRGTTPGVRHVLELTRTRQFFDLI